MVVVAVAVVVSAAAAAAAVVAAVVVSERMDQSFGIHALGVVRNAFLSFR